MSYETAIASFDGDETTLAKSFIISLKNVAANWYTRMPLISITSWAHLKEKFLVNFQGFKQMSAQKKISSPVNSMKEKHYQIPFADSFGLKHKPRGSQMSKL
jgi:hypothetical protein